MRYRDLNSSLSSHITTLRVIIGTMVLINVFLWIGWRNASSDIRIHIPPDIRSGAVVNADEISSVNVYSFASYIFQQIYRWHENGVKNYGQQIFNVSPYLTPVFRSELIKDMEKRRQQGELTGRVRFIQEMPGHGYEERRVDLLDDNNWIVWLDYNIQEFVNGMQVKNVNIRYPLRITRFDVDPESNPWGLALAGFSGKGPIKLDANKPMGIDQRGTDENK